MNNLKNCKRCLMNNSVNDFFLFSDGTCNYCNKFLSNTKYNLFKNKDF